jgi:hypothetical protein
MNATQFPTFDQMYSFLRAIYKHDRFEGRNVQWPNGVPEGGTYAQCVTRSHLHNLQEQGVGHVGPFESVTGAALKYDGAAVVAGGRA